MKKKSRTSWGILKFSLPEEQESFEVSKDGWKWKRALEDFDQDMRSRDKYQDDVPIKPSEIREILYGFLSERGLSFD